MGSLKSMELCFVQKDQNINIRHKYHLLCLLYPAGILLIAHLLLREFVYIKSRAPWSLENHLNKKKKTDKYLAGSLNRFGLQKHTEASSVSINERGADCGSWVQTQISCRLLGETISQGAPRRTRGTACVARNRCAV